jgi:hypothetical protein
VAEPLPVPKPKSVSFAPDVAGGEPHANGLANGTAETAAANGGPGKQPAAQRPRQEGQQQARAPDAPRQLTHFAPAQPTLEQEVAAVLAAPPAVTADDPPSAKAARQVYSLGRGCTTFLLCALQLVAFPVMPQA